MSLHDTIYLASQSPRRRQLLDQLGVHHDLLVPEPGAEADAAGGGAGHPIVTDALFYPQDPHDDAADAGACRASGPAA